MTHVLHLGWVTYRLTSRHRLSRMEHYQVLLRYGGRLRKPVPRGSTTTLHVGARTR